jgi:hypothetical protein
MVRCIGLVPTSFREANSSSVSRTLRREKARVSGFTLAMRFKQLGDLAMKLLTFDVPRFGQTYCKFPTKEEYGEVQEHGNRNTKRRVPSIPKQKTGRDYDRFTDHNNQNIDQQEPHCMH